jgi:hypothetical protein
MSFAQPFNVHGVFGGFKQATGFTVPDCPGVPVHPIGGRHKAWGACLCRSPVALFSEKHGIWYSRAVRSLSTAEIHTKIR